MKKIKDTFLNSLFGKGVLKIHNFLKEWNEIYLTVFTMILWVPLVLFIRAFIDPTAGSFDAGIIQVVYIAMFIFGSIHGFIWLGVYLNYPFIWKYFQSKISEDFKELTAWQRLLFSFLCLSLYLGLMTAIVIQFI